MSQEMNDKEKCDVFLRLYEFRQAHTQERTGIEWKVYISFLSALFVSTGYLAPKIDLNILIILVYVAIGLIFLIWLYGLWSRNHHDKGWIRVYRSNVEKLLGLRDNTETFKETQEKGIKRVFGSMLDWSLRGQVLTFIIFLIICLIVIDAL